MYVCMSVYDSIRKQQILIKHLQVSWDDQSQNHMNHNVSLYPHHWRRLAKMPKQKCQKHKTQQPKTMNPWTCSYSTLLNDSYQLRPLGLLRHLFGGIQLTQRHVCRIQNHPNHGLCIIKLHLCWDHFQGHVDEGIAYGFQRETLQNQKISILDSQHLSLWFSLFKKISMHMVLY